MDYIAKDNPAAAVKLDELIQMVIHPNYIIIYRVLADQVEILRVKHAARKSP